jgi:hypothetical protein
MVAVDCTSLIIEIGGVQVCGAPEGIIIYLQVVAVSPDLISFTDGESSIINCGFGSSTGF